jgi:type I restriction enzyme S subunit
MSRGRKRVVSNNSDWESVFYNSVGTYVQYINLKLAEHIKAEPLSNHIRIAGGYAFKSSDYKKQGVPVIRISDFSNEKIVLDDVVYYDESEDLKRYELNEGDIVIALTGGTIAKLGIVQKGIGKLYLNQRVGKFEVLHPEEFETEYVYWIARSVQSIIKNLAWGAAIPNVSPKQIEELQFPIPDKETQNGIIDFLNDLRANKIEDDREYFNSEVEDFVFSLQANQISGAELKSELFHQQYLLKKLRQAFVQETMQGKLIKQNVDDENATELLNEIKKEKEKLIAEKKLKKETIYPSIKEEEIPFNIPENWQWCRLGVIGICQTGTTPSTAIKEYFGNDIPFIKPADITLKGLITDNEGLSFLGLKEGVLIPPNSLMMVCIGGSIGKSYYTSFNVSCNQQINSVTPLAGITAQFLQYFLQSDYFQKAIWAKASGGTTPIVNRSKWESILIPLPPLQAQNRIVEKLEEVTNLCDEIFESINQSKIEIESLIKTLLNDALGVRTTYNVAKDKTLKQEIRKFQTTDNTFERIKMRIIEILQSSNEPISSTVVWNSSEYSKDIEAFYAELKRLIDIEKLVVEEKRGKESFLKLAANEN